MLVGYEVRVLVGKAMGGTPQGIHDIATWGTIGAASGVAHLLANGDPGVVAAAIDLAATAPVLPDATTVFQGATGQHVLLGLGAQFGVVRGQAAAAGLRPIAGTLERHFLAHAAAALDRDVLRPPVDSTGTRREWSIQSGYLKRHPTCAHLHGVNDAVEDLVGLRAFSASDIARVEVPTYAAAAGFRDPAPTNDLAARFSIPWTVAVSLLTGGIDDGALAPVDDPRVGELAQRFSVVHDPGLDVGYPDGRPAVVVLRLHDGRTFEAASTRPRGDGPAALEDAVVCDKPRRLLASRLGAEGARAVLAAIDRLEEDGWGG